VCPFFLDLLLLYGIVVAPSVPLVMSCYNLEIMLRDRTTLIVLSVRRRRPMCRRLVCWRLAIHCHM
jgi:hypothetical protein